MQQNRFLLLAVAAALIMLWLVLPGGHDPEPELTAPTAGVAPRARAADAVAARGDKQSEERHAEQESSDSAEVEEVATDSGAAARVAEARRDSRQRQAVVARDQDAQDTARLAVASNPPADLLLPELENARALARQGAVAPTPPLVESPGVPAEPDNSAPEVLYDSGDDMQFRSEDQVEVARPGKIVGPSGTISFDLSPQWDESVGYADFVSLGDNVRVTKLADYLQFEIIDAGGARHVVSTKVDEWEPQQAQEIAVTWDERQLHLYVNGRMVAADALEHPIQIADDATLRIGSRYPDGRPIAPATISRVRLRDEFFVPAAPDDGSDGG